LIDGRLRFAVWDSGQKEVASFISQPLGIVGNGFALLSISWSQAGIELRLNGSTVLADAPEVCRLSISTVDQPASSVLSINRPDALVACQKWINNRKAKFSSPVLRRMRFKTNTEQATDLRNSILSIQHIRQQVSGGKLNFLGMLAGELRALLYWKDDVKADWAYNPLLLRMASKADLPLPVYRVKPQPLPAAVKAASIHIDTNIPRLHSIVFTNELVDLQECLESTALRLDSTSRNEKSAKDLIAETADTLGSSHYDEDVSAFIDVLQNTTAFDISTLARYLSEISNVTAQLAEWVISELVGRKIIT
jgi:hypothetical protein